MATKDEIIALLQEEVKGLSSALVDDDYSNACDDASKETGWSFPVSGDFKELWIKLRAKRWLYFYLWTESAHKFKVKQYNLQHRFDHYEKMIKKMDADFEAIQEERPDQFADVDIFRMFGTKVDAGFATDPLGRDITYDSEQEVIFTPDDTD